jgi:hypothetical protein
LGDQYVMDVGREAGFSKAEQVYIREAAIVLQAHTLSDIVTVDGTRIKEGIFEGILEDRKSRYRWPMPQPWQQAYRRVMEKLANYICIRTSILIKKLGAFVDTERSQEFLFQWESTSHRLIDFRENETLEHIKINELHGRRAHFKLEIERGNANYNDLSCADVTITDTHLLMHGRANAIVRVPPPQRRRRRGQEANDPKNTDYTKYGE